MINEVALRRLVAEGTYPAITSKQRLEGLVLAVCHDAVQVVPEGVDAEGRPASFTVTKDGRERIVAYAPWSGAESCDCPWKLKVRPGTVKCEHQWAVIYHLEPPEPVMSGEPRVARPFGPPRPMTPMGDAVPHYLTEHRAMYSRALEFVSYNQQAFFEIVLAAFVPPTAQNPRGRPLMQAREKCRVAYAAVTRNLALRDAAQLRARAYDDQKGLNA